MTNITNRMSSIFHGPLWEFIILGDDIFVCRDMMTLIRDKHLNPMESLISSLFQDAV
jgi:hypothetical protein